MMKGKKLSRREREKLRQRGEILDAAQDLFSEKGFHGVSMQEIAQKAEFAVGSLYKFFKNKEDLYKAFLREQFMTFHDELDRALDAPGDALDKLRSYIRVKSELFIKNQKGIRLYIGESRGTSFNARAGLSEEFQAIYDDTLRKVTSVIQSGIQHKQFKNIVDPFCLSVALTSTVNSFLLLWLDDPEGYPYPEDPDIILNIFLKGLSAD